MAKHAALLTKTLADVGLSKNEIQVYLAGLQLGATSVRQLALSSGLTRTTTYSVIESLMKKGLLSAELRGLRKYYVPENPQQLRNMFEARLSNLDRVLPQLASIFHYQESESIIRHYKGIESIKRIYDATLEDVRPRDFYFVLSNSALWSKLDEEYFTAFIRKRAKLYSDIRLLLLDNPMAQEHKRHEIEWNIRIKFLPQHLKVTTIMIVIPRRVIVHDLLPPHNAVVLENRSSVQMLAQLFENMWALTP